MNLLRLPLASLLLCVLAACASTPGPAAAPPAPAQASTAAAEVEHGAATAAAAETMPADAPLAASNLAADAQLAMGCVGQGTQFIDGLTKLLKDSRCTTQQNLAVRSRGNAAIGAIE